MIARSSSLVLILANVVPLVGVITLGWDVLGILLLYWTESVVIGVVNVFRMMKCRPDNLLGGLAALHSKKSISPEALAQINSQLPAGIFSIIKLVIIPFFIFHYGAFCFGHLKAVIGFFSDSAMQSTLGSSLQYFWQPEYWIAVVAIAGSHLFSYFKNFIGKNEYQKANLFFLMQRPYGRIAVMQITIILGAGLVMWLGDPLLLVAVLVVAKTTIDFKMHNKERDKFAAEKATSSVSVTQNMPIGV